MTARFLAMYETPTDIDAFERHYQEVHVPLAKRLPGLRSYTISRGIHAVRGDTTYYMVAMLDWDDLEALRAAFASRVGQETAADVANLTALAPTVSMTFEVVEV